MVFQSYALYPTMSVRENIAFGLKIRKMPQAAIDEEVARVARLLQIEHLLERKPSQLSGGQQQRVAMGLARRPKVYLFDEPLSNLDAKLRVEMRTELKLMHQRLKTTTVYVTHDQIEAMTLGDKVAVMKDGVIQQFGTPQQIYNDPANLFVASFIGSPPMNFIPLRLQRRDGRWTGLLDSGQDRIELPLSLEPSLEEGRELILGVRPEQIALGDGSAAHDLRTEVEVLEPTGPDTLVFVTVNQVKVCCRLAPDVAPAAGSGMSLRFDPARVLLFDAQSGERVAHGGRGGGEGHRLERQSPEELLNPFVLPRPQPRGRWKCTRTRKPDRPPGPLAACLPLERWAWGARRTPPRRSRRTRNGCSATGAASAPSCWRRLRLQAGVRRRGGGQPRRRL